MVLGWISAASSSSALSRVDDQALHVRHIGQQREDLQRVNESMGLLHAALDIEGEDGGAAVGEVLLKQRVIRMIGQRGVVDLLHLRVPGEKLHHLFGVLCVAVEAQGQGLHALQQQKGIEGRNAGAGVTKNNSPEIGNEGSGAGRVHKGDAVIAGIGLRNRRKLTGGLPVELAGIHHDAAERRAMSADELGGGMQHDIRAMLNGPDQIGRAKGVVDHKGDLMGMGDRRDGVDIRNVGIGVAKGLEVDGLGIGLDGSLHLR